MNFGPIITLAVIHNHCLFYDGLMICLCPYETLTFPSLYYCFFFFLTCQLLAVCFLGYAPYK